KHHLEGPSYGTVSACAAGAHAIGTATRMVAHGEADVAVTGGSEAAITALAMAAFEQMDALSDSGISRPFDRRRDGFVMGEGAGDARPRGARRGPGPGLRAGRRAPDGRWQWTGTGRALERLRLRRPQRRAVPGGRAFVSVAVTRQGAAEPVRLGPRERLELLCDEGSLEVIRSTVTTRRNGRSTPG